jgi:hypothetical protein
LPPINGPSFGDGVLDVSAAFLGNERLPDWPLLKRKLPDCR